MALLVKQGLLICTLLFMCAAQACALEHAHPKVFGVGWECDQGFYKNDGQCLAVVIPKNGRLNLIGDGWECQKGYFSDGNACVPVHVPDHAELDTFGNGWRCRRGYYKDGKGCAWIKLPAHARLDMTGNEWECEDGFRLQGVLCVSMSPDEKKAQERRRRLEQAGELDLEQLSGRATEERPPCLAGYNKCTSSCYVTVYDRSTGMPLNSNDFEANCFASCSTGQSRCDRENPAHRCDAFARACSRACPSVVFDKALGKRVQDTNGRSICENACVQGKHRCVYQAQKLH